MVLLSVLAQGLVFTTGALMIIWTIFNFRVTKESQGDRSGGATHTARICISPSGVFADVHTQGRAPVSAGYDETARFEPRGPAQALGRHR